SLTDPATTEIYTLSLHDALPILVTVDDFHLGAERGEHVTHRRKGRAHHELAVEARVVLRPRDCLDVVVEVLRSLGQIREILVGQVDEPAPHVLLRELDEVASDAVADAT